MITHTSLYALTLGPLSDVLGLPTWLFVVLVVVIALLGLAALLWWPPYWFLRLINKTIPRVTYRVKLRGWENVPRGGALLVSNHMSWMDGTVITGMSPRLINPVAYAGNMAGPLLSRAAETFGIITMWPSPGSIRTAIKEVRRRLADGKLVLLFAEGGITRSGGVQGFRPGVMSMLKGTGVPVVPVYLDGLWGSKFSHGKHRRLPLFARVTVTFGRPMHDPTDRHEIRQKLLEVGAEAVTDSTRQRPTLPRQFIRNCKRSKSRSKVADSTGADLSGANLLLRSLILRRLLLREILEDDEEHVGVLLPPSAGAVVTNLAIALCRRVSVNLNYTVTGETMNFCIKHAGVRHVLTSRKFMEKIDYDLDCEIVYLEDLRDRVRWTDKMCAALQTYACPAWCLERRLGLHRAKHDDVLTVIFTSGSTGTPKGVMLTHQNLSSNVEAIDQVIKPTEDDVILGILPFFHSLGYTATLWTVAALKPKAVYHYTPLEPRQVAKLCQQHRGTILLATPTFLRNYLRRVDPEDFQTLDMVVTGAERLPADLADAFEEKFNIRPIEGYGVTELSPLVSVNVPPSRSQDNFQDDCRDGTVGRPVPGVAAKTVHLDTGEDLPPGEAGMLHITGPNVMKGYLHQPERTAESIKDGWYVTGDVAEIDEDGFITITGRISRFSKIGGEMVPHVTIEDALYEQLETSEDESPKLAVTSVDHPKKGERLVVLHTDIDKSPEQLRQGLHEQGMPNLYIPSEDSFVQVEELPILGSGKLDLKRVKQMAEERFPA